MVVWQRWQITMTVRPPENMFVSLKMIIILRVQQEQRFDRFVGMPMPPNDRRKEREFILLHCSVAIFIIKYRNK